MYLKILSNLFRSCVRSHPEVVVSVGLKFSIDVNDVKVFSKICIDNLMI